MTGVREWLQTAREERWGMLTDLVFAILWVTGVDLIVRLLDGPDWARYMFMAAGIIAYFGLIWSYEVAKQTQ